MRPFGFAIIIFVAISGCADEADPLAAPTGTPSEPTAAGSTDSPTVDEPPAGVEQELLRQIEMAFSLEVQTRGSAGEGPSENCIFISMEPGALVHSGAAEATWTPESPLSEELRISAGEGSGEVRAERRGPSTLQIDIPEFHPGTAPYVVVEAPIGIALAVSQPVTLTVTLQVSGGVTLGNVGSCGR